jgi:2-hydroxycyclohexanecarboxyl-CoA dehydrogenase
VTHNVTYVVTGGASGIGLATACLLADTGATVIIGDIDTKNGETVARDHANIEFVSVDLRDAASITAFAETILGRHSKIDGVVNAAGWDRVEPFMDNDPALWDALIGINLLGTIRMTRAFLPGMIEAQAGKIVTVSSDAGRVGSMGETVYSAAKGGIIAFTKALAREMARYKINVNCICPGPTDTPLLHAQTSDWAMRIKEGMTRSIPFRRLAKPEEIAEGIAFFLSPKSAYVTGQVLSISGGLTMVD